MQSHRRVVIFQVVVVALVLISCSVPAFAQAGFGAISGRVADPNGLSVAGAKVQAIKVDTNTTSTAETNEVGLFSFPSLPPGTYRIIVQKEGFQQIVNPDFELHVADSLAMNFSLQVGSISQTVTVTGEAAVVNTENSTLGGLVNETRMADLPLNGRNYTDLVTIQAGINVAATMGSSNQQGGTRGTFLSADGATIRSNMYMLDGAILLNARGGTTASESGTSLGVDGIKEFKVVTGTYGAEYGAAMGGQVNMVSKGGGNQLHGDVFDYMRNSDMDSRNFFDYGYQLPGQPRLPRLQRNNFGASAGGPIKKNKTFVFGTYEGLRLRQGQTVLDSDIGAGCHGAAGTVITTTACSQLTKNTTVSAVTAPWLALYPNPNLPGNEFSFPVEAPGAVDYGQIRIDQNFSATDTLFGRYTTDKSTYLTPVSAFTTTGAGVGWPNESVLYTSRDHYGTVGENHIFSPSLLNTARISYSRIGYGEQIAYNNGINSLISPQLSFSPGFPMGQLSVTGVSSFNESDQFPYIGQINYYQLNDDLFYTKGKHSLKFGFAGIKWNPATRIGGAQVQEISFSSITNFLSGVPSSWDGLQNAATAITDRNWNYYSFGFYAQDDYHVAPRLTLNLGLRYEFMTTPMNAPGRNYGIVDIATDPTTTAGPLINPPSKLNFSPRVGFAYDVFGNGKTALRGGFGEYYDIGDMTALLGTGMTVGMPPLTVRAIHNNSLFPETLAVPFVYQPVGSALDPGGEYPTMQIAEYHLGTPHILKWNLTVDRQFPAAIGLTVTYNGSRGLSLYQANDGNPAIPGAFVNAIPWYNGTQSRENTKLPPMYQVTQTGGSSKYDALIVQLNKRVTHGLEVQTAYTWSHLLTTTESQNGSGDCGSLYGMANALYPNNPSLLDHGPACYDIAQNYRINFLYHFPNIKSDNMAARMLHGWWMGSIYTFNTGYPFSPDLTNGATEVRDQSGNSGQTADRPNVATAADAANCPSLTSTYNGLACKMVPVPFNPSTVITGNPQQWYNPNMFVLTPMTQTPGGALCTVAPCWGTLGNAARGLLRGPRLSEFDFSINKDTRLAALGEQGMVEFRAEIFNLPNHPNFAMPSVVAYSGTPTDISPYAEAASATAGRITATFTTSRQIQLSLKIIF